MKKVTNYLIVISLLSVFFCVGLTLNGNALTEQEMSLSVGSCCGGSGYTAGTSCKADSRTCEKLTRTQCEGDTPPTWRTACDAESSPTTTGDGNKSTDDTGVCVDYSIGPCEPQGAGSGYCTPGSASDTPSCGNRNTKTTC